MKHLLLLIVLTGLAISLSSISLFTPENYAFAIEFSNYTSEKYGIQFEYPEWKINEKSRFDSAPDMMIADFSSSRSFNLGFPISSGGSLANVLDILGFEKVIQLALHIATKGFEEAYEAKIIEEPSMMSIDGKETVTFLVTSEDKYEPYAVKYARQFWITNVNDKLYAFKFIAPTTIFDDPENIEIRDHFIKSIKFLGDSELEVEPQQKLRFD